MPMITQCGHLSISVAMGSVECVKELLQSPMLHIDVPEMWYETTALHISATARLDTITKLLVEKNVRFIPTT